MFSLIYKILVTIFYGLLFFFSIANFFSEKFFIYFIQSTAGYEVKIDLAIVLLNLFFLGSFFYVLWENKNRVKKRMSWLMISIFFPFIIVYFVWKHGTIRTNSNVGNE
mgnify:CR=1 FL=1